MQYRFRAVYRILACPNRIWIIHIYYTPMLHFAILYYTMLCYTLLCCTILCFATGCYVILSHTMLDFAMLYYTLLCDPILYYTVLYYIVLHCTILYCTVPCYTVLDLHFPPWVTAALRTGQFWRSVAHPRDIGGIVLTSHWASHVVSCHTLVFLGDGDRQGRQRCPCEERSMSWYCWWKKSQTTIWDL